MRRMLPGLIKAAKWLSLAVVSLALLLLAAWFLIPDEDLHAEVFQILNAQPSIPPEQNSFYAMWGFKAAPSLAPHIVGRKILETLNQAHTQHRKVTEADLQEFWGVPQLKIDSTGMRFCKMDAVECLPQLRAAREKIESSEREFDLYVRRYHALRDYPDFEEVLPASLDIPMVDFSDFVALSDLTDARVALDMGDKAKQKEALRNLAAELKLWRKIGQNAHSLVTKIIAASVLQRKFKLASELLTEAPEIAVQHSELLVEITRPLTAIEASVSRTLTGELRLTSGVFLGLADEREIDGSNALGSIPGRLLMIGTFKPNATINLQYTLYSAQREFYAQPASIVAEKTSAFLAELNDFSPLSPRTLFYNPVGKVLVYVSPLDWSKYVYAMHDLTAYTRLVELQRRIAAARIGIDEIPAFVATDDSLRNPYTGKPMRWDAQSQTLSLQGYGKARDTLVIRVGIDR